MKKMVKVAALAAMVLSVALTGCNGKKGEASSSSTEVSEKSNSPAIGRKEINAFFKDSEKLVKKMEKAATKRDGASFASLMEEFEKLGEKYVNIDSSSDWNDDDTAKLNSLANRLVIAGSMMGY